MKKITTLLMCVCFAVSAAFASISDAGILPNVKYQLTPEGMQKMRTGYAKAKLAAENGADNCYTRSMIVDGTRIWTLSVLLSEERICDMVQGSDSNGAIVTYDFDQIPYYAAYYAITCRVLGEADIYHYIYYTMCWPSQYVYKQVFEYDNYNVPESERDYDPVPMSELANNADFTNNFKESEYINSDFVSGSTKWEYWTLLQNSLDSNGGVCIYEGKDAQTVVSGDTGSTIVFNSFDKETNDINVQARYIVRFYPDGTSTRTLRSNFTGEARVEGFEHIDQTLPEFGDMHLFNVGQGSSSLYGDLNPYSDAWGPFTELYVAVGDSHIIWDFDETAKEFSRYVISVQSVDVENELELDEYANVVLGYFYADSQYADTSLNPEGTFTMANPLIDSETNTVEIVPSRNSFVPYGYTGSWSTEYGTYFMVNNETDVPAYGSMLGWGTTDGLRMQFNNQYKKTIYAQSTGNVIYHYDPTDVQKMRVYPMVGTLEFGSNAVETIAAENATITAANGVISVVPADACNVAVYNLDGTCVKSVKAEAGSNVSVEVEKGVYVVVAGSASKKVAL